MHNPIIKIAKIIRETAQQTAWLSAQINKKEVNPQPWINKAAGYSATATVIPESWAQLRHCLSRSEEVPAWEGKEAEVASTLGLPILTHADCVKGEDKANQPYTIMAHFTPTPKAVVRAILLL